MLKITSLAIFTTIILSGCCTVKPPAPHPVLTFPKPSSLPSFTREMIDCSSDHPENLPLCRKIKEREAVLKDDIETRDALLEIHNEELKDQ